MFTYQKVIQMDPWGLRGMSPEEVAEKFHSKYYSDLDKEEFSSRFLSDEPSQVTADDLKRTVKGTDDMDDDQLYEFAKSKGLLEESEEPDEVQKARFTGKADWRNPIEFVGDTVKKFGATSNRAAGTMLGITGNLINLGEAARGNQTALLPTLGAGQGLIDKGEEFNQRAEYDVFQASETGQAQDAALEQKREQRLLEGQGMARRTIAAAGDYLTDVPKLAEEVIGNAPYLMTSLGVTGATRAVLSKLGVEGMRLALSTGATAALTAGAMEGQDAYYEAKDQVGAMLEGMTHDERMENSPLYAELMGKDVSEDMALKLTAAKAGQGAQGIATIIGTIAGIPGAAMNVRLSGAGKLMDTSRSQVLMELGGETLEELVQEGGNAYAVNRAIRGHADPTKDVWEGVPEAAGTGAALGFGTAGPLNAGSAVKAVTDTVSEVKEGGLGAVFNRAPDELKEIKRRLMRGNSPVSPEEVAQLTEAGAINPNSKTVAEKIRTVSDLYEAEQQERREAEAEYQKDDDVENTVYSREPSTKKAAQEALTELEEKYPDLKGQYEVSKIGNKFEVTTSDVAKGREAERAKVHELQDRKPQTRAEVAAAIKKAKETYKGIDLVPVRQLDEHGNPTKRYVPGTEQQAKQVEQQIKDKKAQDKVAKAEAAEAKTAEQKAFVQSARRKRFATREEAIEHVKGKKTGLVPAPRGKGDWSLRTPYQRTALVNKRAEEKATAREKTEAKLTRGTYTDPAAARLAAKEAGIGRGLVPAYRKDGKVTLRDSDTAKKWNAAYKERVAQQKVEAKEAEIKQLRVDSRKQTFDKKSKASLIGRKTGDKAIPNPDGKGFVLRSPAQIKKIEKQQAAQAEAEQAAQAEAAKQAEQTELAALQTKVAKLEAAQKKAAPKKVAPKKAPATKTQQVEKKLKAKKAAPKKAVKRDNKTAQPTIKLHDEGPMDERARTDAERTTAEMKGKELDTMLRERNLSTGGRVADRRARLNDALTEERMESEQAPTTPVLQEAEARMAEIEQKMHDETATQEEMYEWDELSDTVDSLKAEAKQVASEQAPATKTQQVEKKLAKKKATKKAAKKTTKKKTTKKKATAKADRTAAIAKAAQKVQDETTNVEQAADEAAVEVEEETQTLEQAEAAAKAEAQRTTNLKREFTKARKAGLVVSEEMTKEKGKEGGIPASIGSVRYYEGGKNSNWGLKAERVGRGRIVVTNTQTGDQVTIDSAAKNVEDGKVRTRGTAQFKQTRVTLTRRDGEVVSEALEDQTGAPKSVKGGYVAAINAARGILTGQKRSQINKATLPDELLERLVSDDGNRNWWLDNKNDENTLLDPSVASLSQIRDAYMKYRLGQLAGKHNNAEAEAMAGREWQAFVREQGLYQSRLEQRQAEADAQRDAGEDVEGAIDPRDETIAWAQKVKRSVIETLRASGAEISNRQAAQQVRRAGEIAAELYDSKQIAATREKVESISGEIKRKLRENKATKTQFNKLNKLSDPELRNGAEEMGLEVDPYDNTLAHVIEAVIESGQELGTPIEDDATLNKLNEKLDDRAQERAVERANQNERQGNRYSLGEQQKIERQRAASDRVYFAARRSGWLSRLLSPQKPRTAAEVRAALEDNDILAPLLDSGEVQLVSSEELTAYFPDETRGDGTVEGLYDPVTDTVYLMETMTSNPVAVAYHELLHRVGTYAQAEVDGDGILDMFTGEQRDELAARLEELETSGTATEQAALAEARRKWEEVGGLNADPQAAAMELLAYQLQEIVQSKEDQSAFQQVMEWLKNLFSEWFNADTVGFDVATMSANDFVDLMGDALASLATGDYSANYAARGNTTVRGRTAEKTVAPTALLSRNTTPVTPEQQNKMGVWQKLGLTLRGKNLVKSGGAAVFNARQIAENGENAAQKEAGNRHIEARNKVTARGESLLQAPGQALKNLNRRVRKHKNGKAHLNRLTYITYAATEAEYNPAMGGDQIKLTEKDYVKQRMAIKKVKNPERQNSMLKELQRKRKVEIRRAAAKKKLDAQWKLLPQPFKDAYTEMLHNLNGLNQTLTQEVLHQAEGAQSAGKRSALYKHLKEKFETGEKINPYFPLSRFGNTWVAVKDAEGNLVEFRMFEQGLVDRVKRFGNGTPAQQYVEKMRQKHPGYEITEPRSIADSPAGMDVVDPTFASQVNELIAGAESLSAVEQKNLQDQIWQLYLQTLPDQNIRKAFLHRKNTAGYDHDIIRTFANHTQRMASHIAKMEYREELRDSLQEMKEAATNEYGDMISHTMHTSYDWFMQPETDDFATSLTKFGFVSTLGFGLSTAGINTTQTWMLGPAIMGARYGIGTSYARLAKHSTQWVKHAAGRVKGAVDNRNELTVPPAQRFEDRYGYEVAEAFAIARGHRLFDDTLTHSFLQLGEGDNHSLYSKLVAASGKPMHWAEVYNREVTFVTAYELERELQKKTRQDYDSPKAKQDAVDRAMKITWDVHFDYSQGNRSAFIRGPVKSVVFLFQQYSTNLVYRVTKDIADSFQKVPEGLSNTERAEFKAAQYEARRRAMYTQAQSLAWAGLAGSPFYLAAKTVAWMLAAAVGDDDEFLLQDSDVIIQKAVYDVFGRDLGDVFMKGLPEGGLRVGVSSRISMDLVNNLPFMMNYKDLKYVDWADKGEVAQQMLDRVGGPAVGNFSKSAMAIYNLAANDVHPAEVQKEIEKAIPSKAVRDILKNTRYATEGATVKENKLAPVKEADEFTVASLMLGALGFSDPEVSARYANNRMLYRATKHLTDTGRQLNERQALEFERDGAVSPETQAEIARYNDYVTPLGMTRVTPKTRYQRLKGQRQARARSVQGRDVANPRLEKHIRDRYGYDE